MKHLFFLITALFIGVSFFSLFSNSQAQAWRGRDNCGRGFSAKEDGPGPVSYTGDETISSVFVKRDKRHGDPCKAFYEDKNNGCYEIEGLGTKSVTVTKVGTDDNCKDIEHVEFYAFACEEDDSTPEPTPSPTPTPTPTPRTDIPGLSCPAGTIKYTLNSSPYTLTVWEPLKGYGVTLPNSSQVTLKVASMVGHPDQGCQAGSSNDASNYPCDQGQNHEEFNVLIDDIQSAFVPDHGEDKWQVFTFPLVQVFSKGYHQVNFRHSEQGKPDKQSVDFVAAVCAGPVVPSSTPTATPVVTPSPTPSAGKQSKLAVTQVSCTQQNVDAIAELFNDGKPVENVTVKFIYNNEAKFAKTDKDGKAVVQYGYRNDSDVKIEPEEGYPHQLHKAIGATNCPTISSVGSVLGAGTSKGKIASGATTGQIEGMAATGMAEDMIMRMVGLTGAIFSTVAVRLYAKKN